MDLADTFAALLRRQAEKTLTAWLQQTEACAVRVTVQPAVLPAVTGWLTGLSVTTGNVLTVNRAAVVWAVPALLVKTARKALSVIA